MVSVSKSAWMCLAPIHMCLLTEALVHAFGNLLTEAKLGSTVPNLSQGFLMVLKHGFLTTRAIGIHVHHGRIAKTVGFVIGGAQEFGGFASAFGEIIPWSSIVLQGLRSTYLKG